MAHDPSAEDRGGTAGVEGAGVGVKCCRRVLGTLGRLQPKGPSFAD